MVEEVSKRSSHRHYIDPSITYLSDFIPLRLPVLHLMLVRFPARSGYRVQADQEGNPTRVLYYMERELANLDPSRPMNAPGKYSRREFWRWALSFITLRVGL